MTSQPVFKDTNKLDEDVAPILAGTKIKVIEVIAAMIFFGSRDIFLLFPDCSSCQIFSAITFFNRWRDELREELADMLDNFDGVAMWRNLGYL